MRWKFWWQPGDYDDAAIDYDDNDDYDDDDLVDIDVLEILMAALWRRWLMKQWRANGCISDVVSRKGGVAVANWSALDGNL